MEKAHRPQNNHHFQSLIHDNKMTATYTVIWYSADFLVTTSFLEVR